MEKDIPVFSSLFLSLSSWKYVFADENVSVVRVGVTHLSLSCREGLMGLDAVVILP